MSTAPDDIEPPQDDAASADTLFQTGFEAAMQTLAALRGRLERLRALIDEQEIEMIDKTQAANNADTYHLLDV